jgi:hypothetical protein
MVNLQRKCTVYQPNIGKRALKCIVLKLKNKQINMQGALSAQTSSK